ncbi:MAG: hypothetical protein U5K81_01245 [Trueperaceae bacterium]|nr:hypothetical protein [Trueperaceae bacterium]
MHLDALRTTGFNDADIIELVTAVGQAAFATTIADTLDIDPSDPFAATRPLSVHRRGR